MGKNLVFRPIYMIGVVPRIWTISCTSLADTREQVYNLCLLFLHGLALIGMPEKSNFNQKVLFLQLNSLSFMPFYFSIPVLI